jgi:ankyrin repeat protein
VAIRPLEVKELAEVLAVDFDDCEGIPKLKPDWRWEDEEQALLMSCSSLVTTVETGYSRVVQFSHFSVKEYLTSERLATSNEDVSRYHIDLEPAHTILVQACMSVLLQPDDSVDDSDSESGVEKWSPLAEYAAEHWVTHAQFKSVSSFLQKAMEDLFDLDKPYFAAWLQLYDIDSYPRRRSSFFLFAISVEESGANPIYYAALCGFEDLVEHLVVKYSEHLDISGGCYVTPLFAALAGRHFRAAQHLHRNGARVDVRGDDEVTPLDSAAYYGDLEMVQVLLDYEVDVNVRDINSWTPIHTVSYGSRSPDAHSNIPQLWHDVARLLLEHGADVNTRMDDGRSPLHWAGTDEVVRVLLEHGANVGAVDNEGRTPLHLARMGEVVRVLLERGANVGVVDNQGKTPLHAAAGNNDVKVVAEVVRVLLEHGANIGAVNNQGRTPLHAAAENTDVKVVRVLLEHGENIGAVDNQGKTPLHVAAENSDVGTEVVRVLLERGANADAEDNKGRTAFQIASTRGDEEVVELLSECGAKVL